MKSFTQLLRIMFLLTLLCLCSACAWLQAEDEDETAGWSANRFYSEAKRELNGGGYSRAIELFEKLQARYPFGRFAQQAQLELMYAHYKNSEPDQAIAAADRFIRTHPRHPFVDYAYYLKGLANFNRGIGLIERLLPPDPTKTDTGSAQQAFNDFGELLQRFPQSRYAEDARQRMLFLRNNLAAYEINVADYYIRRKAYVAAANRGKYVLENYSSTPSVAEALMVMVKAYHKLELADLANDSLKVLALNYPDSVQLAEAQAFVAGRAVPKRDSGFSLSSLWGWL